MGLHKAKEIVTSCPVVVFSKSYCGYCRRVKQLLTQLGASFKVIELDEENINFEEIVYHFEGDGDDIQSALEGWTGQGTIPNVFIGGKHVGGCDTLVEKHQEGTLVPLLAEAGAIANNSGQL